MPELNIYRDVSTEPDAAARATKGPELHQELLDLGFEPVGYVERRITIASEKERAQVQKAYAEPDASDIIKIAEEGEVLEILKSPDARALATVKQSYGGPIVRFRTVSEDGRIVDTSSPAPRNPLYRNRLAGLFSKLFGARDSSAAKKRSGHYTQTKSAGVADLWARHQEHVRSILGPDAEALRPHDSVAIFVAGGLHVGRIDGAASKTSQMFLSRAAVISRIALFLPVLVCGLFCATGRISMENLQPTLNITLAYMAVLLGVLVLTTVVFYRYVVHQVGGPEPMTLDDLLQEIEQLYGISVEEQRAGSVSQV